MQFQAHYSDQTEPHARLWRWIRSIGLFLLIWCSGWSVGLVQAQMRPPGPVGPLARSSSGQFIIQTVPHPGQVRSRYASSLQTNRNYITLDATVLPVSCERIKQALWRQLGLGAPWSGRIYLALYTAGSGEDPVTLTSAQFRDGWQYRLELPDLIDRVEFVRSVVDALLLEVANRSARERSAEIPAWLSEGLTQELLSSSEIEIVLPPPKPGSGGLMLTSMMVSGRKEDSLSVVHQVLCAKGALSFQQLSWPGPEQVNGEAGQIYRSSAHFFVNQLLRMPGGQRCMTGMLAELPQHYNWQFAFLKAFASHFQRPLDVEKWWALHVEHFTGRELTQTWALDESWSKFNEIVRPAVRVHALTNDLPLRAEVSLQTIICDWETSRQIPALQAKVRQLEQLRLRLAPDLVPLADEYHRVLAIYLETRDHSLVPFRKKAAQRHAAADAAKQLDRLDAKLQSLRSNAASIAARK